MDTNKERSLANRYLCALLVPALVTGLMALTWPLFKQVPASLFLLAVMFSAWYGGLGPGLMSVIISALLAEYFFIEPYFSISWQGHVHAIRLAVLLVGAITCGVLGDLIRKERRRSANNLAAALRAEEARRQSDANYQALFEANPMPMWAYDIETLAFLAVNDAAVQQYGYSRDEFLAMTIADIRPPEDVPALRAAVAALSNGGGTEASTWRHLRKDNTTIEVEIRSSFLDFAGRQARLVLASDITDRTRAAEAQRKAEEKYSDIFENAVEGIFQTTQDGHFLTANPALARLLGYDSPEELLRSRTDIARQQYVEPARRAEFTQMLEAQGVVREFAHQAYRKDGSTIWLSESGRSVCDLNGQVLYYEGFTEDITARKLAEQEKEQLLANEHQLRLQAEVMGDASLALTQDLSQERVLETLLDYLHKLVPYDSANVMLVDENSKFVVSAIKGYERFLSGPSVARANTFEPESNLLFARICSSASSLLVDDTRNEPSWQTVPGSQHSRNWLGVPLIAYGKIIGLYSLDKTVPGFFTPDHVRLAESLAASAASAIQNARLFQQVKEHALELEQRIAERERVEQALRESESYRRTIIESQPECVKLVGADCTLLDMNPAGLAMIGADSREQVIGQSVLSLVAPEWQDRFVKMNERVFNGESIVSEFEIVGLKGVRRKLETHATPLRNSDSNIIAHLAITRDVTESIRARESLNLLRNLRNINPPMLSRFSIR